MKLSAKMEAFDSFWEGPDDIEKGYNTFYKFYRANYLKYLPADKNAKILVISCGPGYFLNLLRIEGYGNGFGIDSDAEKIAFAKKKNFDCSREDVFEFLGNHDNKFDVIVAEQEINHLTLDEINSFLLICKQRLTDKGTLILHSLNGANPITGSESLAQNIDHFNTFTEYSLKQILNYSGFEYPKIFPLNLYVFYNNPLNYAAIAVTLFTNIIFKIFFKLYGKSNALFTKKIGAVCHNSK